MTEQQQQQQPQANGEYPRLNSAMVASGRYNGLLVSLVGRFQEGGRLFACCDGGTVPLSVEHMDESAMHLIHNTNTGMVVEVVGQISSPSLVAVRFGFGVGLPQQTANH